MTTLLQANEAFLQLFKTVWAPTGYSYQFENNTFVVPDAPWARFSIRHAEASQETLGSIGARKFRRTGSCFTQIFTLTNTGTKVSSELSEIVVDAFEGTRITGTTIYFTDTVAREIGPEGRWFQRIVEASFTYFETK